MREACNATALNRTAGSSRCLRPASAAVVSSGASPARKPPQTSARPASAPRRSACGTCERATSTARGPGEEEHASREHASRLAFASEVRRREAMREWRELDRLEGRAQLLREQARRHGLPPRARGASAQRREAQETRSQPTAPAALPSAPPAAGGAGHRAATGSGASRGHRL